MNKFYTASFILLFFFLDQQAYSQQPARFTAGNFIPAKQSGMINAADLSKTLFSGRYYVLIQFDKIPSEQTKAQLKQLGVDMDIYIPGNSFLASVPSNTDLNTLNRYGVISIDELPAFYKTEPASLSYTSSFDKEKLQYFAVSYYPSLSLQTVEEELKGVGANIIHTRYHTTNIVFVQPSTGLAARIATLPFVYSISLQSLKDKALNYNSIGTHGISALQSPDGRNLRGANVCIGMGDNADISTHIDFTGRLINRFFNVPDYHGTHTSGTAAGAGIINPKLHGMAPKATIVSQWFSDVIVNTPTYVTDYNMVATNNSYYSSEVGCPGEGAYDMLSNYIDAQLYLFPEVLHVIAAGNDGGNNCAPYTSGFATVKTGWQTAKNVITVGAINQADYTIANFSSKGPVNDNRIKPEIVSNGWAQQSTYPYNTYGTSFGTSMAAPIVTGSIALLQERYRQLHSGSNAPSALIKALMCNSAEDLGNTGPDYTFGFGLLNARRAVEGMETNRFYGLSMSNAQVQNTDINVPAGVRRAKIMLCWTDKEAASNAAQSLVNDLDLTVTDALNVTHAPLVLNGSPATVNNLAIEGPDHINNIEQVVIDNPVAGTLSINVSGFSVPFGPQQCFIVYQFDSVGVTVEYPYGGEKWVPGETENIRWSTNGNEGSSFSVEYSDNGASSWNMINNNVPAGTRLLPFTVPAVASNNALIRVTQNSTGFSDVSNYFFTIIGQPDLTPVPTVPCEGYVQLNWSAIPNASSYSIYQLKGDSMAVIGSTGSNSFLVSGLNSNTEYWFAVSTDFNGVTGRRSMAKNITPSAGPCTLGNFDNNFKAVSIDAPVTGRQFTSTTLSSNESVKLTFRNLDDQSHSGPFTVSYQVNNGTVFSEIVNTPVASLGSYTHTFSLPVDLSVPGTYHIQAWIDYTGDTQLQDDTATIDIKQLANPLLTLPAANGFESTTAKEYDINTMGLDGDDQSDFKTNDIRGRARTFVNTGFARTGNRALTLDQFPLGTLVTDSLLMTYNLGNYNLSQQLRLDFYYKNHGQDFNPDNKVWIRANDTEPWVKAYDLDLNQGAIGQWQHALININDVLDTIVPLPVIGTSFQVKYGEQGNTSANVPYPELDQDDGYTFDDISMRVASVDVALLKLVSPVKDGCGLSSTDSIVIRVKNYTSSVINNVQVNYRINNGAVVSEIIPVLNANQQLDYTFTQRADLSAFIDYNIDSWVSAPLDDYALNDSVLNYQLHGSPVISSYPYLEGFETNNGNWYAKGINSTWAYGTPAKTLINKAANGTKAWVTNLTGNYSNSEFSYLYSPCFDLSSLSQPVLSFSHIFQVELDFDYTWVEYSVDGIVWQKLGVSGSGTNWYDDATDQAWSVSNTKWHEANIDIPPGLGVVRFRIVMSSDGGVTYEGVGIDDVHIFDKKTIYNSIPVTGVVQNVSGSNWIDFSSGGNIFASVNAMGQNLGNTTADVYPYTGTVRSTNSQYYLDRNIVIRPEFAPATPVKIRFYFTNAEANNLVNATGCPACTKPYDPYELGVTKFSGAPAIENGTLADNTPGVLQYILPANTDIIPDNGGYYAEFAVNSFSEFWLNNGGAGFNQPIPLTLLNFDAVKRDKTVLLDWSTENEINTASFTIERSIDGINFYPIGNVTAHNTGNTNTYTYLDVSPPQKVIFYRLKMTNQDGSYSRSAIRKIVFGTTGQISIYPNPVVDNKFTISTDDIAEKAVLYDASGKRIKEFILTGRENIINTKGIASGVYLLTVFTNSGLQNVKIVLQ